VHIRTTHLPPLNPEALQWVRHEMGSHAIGIPGTGSAIKRVLEYCRDVKRNNIDIFFHLLT
jgi:hypothetical protein